MDSLSTPIRPLAVRQHMDPLDESRADLLTVLAACGPGRGCVGPSDQPPQVRNYPSEREHMEYRCWRRARNTAIEKEIEMLTWLKTEILPRLASRPLSHSPPMPARGKPWQF